jgi:5-methylcytosine-specific restriction protein A
MTKPWGRRPDAPDRLRGRKGQERRLRWLARHPLCVHCQAKGRVTLGTEVDHVVPLFRGGPDSTSNLQTLCRPCHGAKTLADRGHKPRQRFGADGYAIDD